MAELLVQDFRSTHPTDGLYVLVQPLRDFFQVDSWCYSGAANINAARGPVQNLLLFECHRPYLFVRWQHEWAQHVSQSGSASDKSRVIYLDRCITFPTESASHIVHTLFMAYDATCTESATDYITEEP